MNMSELGVSDDAKPLAAGVRLLTLRAESRVREYTSRMRKGHPSKQIIFIHIPKTAGTTVFEYVKACVGGRNSGRTAKLSELSLSRDLDESKIQKARDARFCTGTISWPTVEKIVQGNHAFVFTFLREPYRRLWSLYNFLHGARYPQRMIPPEFRTLYDDITRMSAKTFFSSTDPQLLHMTDNAMVRQLGGNMKCLSVDEESGPNLVEAAQRNLSKLDYVGFTDTFAADFPRIVSLVDLPRLKEVPVIKVSRPELKSEADKSRAFDAFVDEVGPIIDPLVRWDQELYEFAEREYRDREQPLV